MLLLDVIASETFLAKHRLGHPGKKIKRYQKDMYSIKASGKIFYLNLKKASRAIALIYRQIELVMSDVFSVITK